jgi:hypothetical protein
MAVMTMQSRDRVSLHTNPEVARSIHRRLEERLCFYEQHPDLIPERLRELDVEWDIERSLETVSSSLSLFGLVMGVLGKRRWLLLPLTVQGFFLQHAVEGWCPPLPALRRLGMRTQVEIDEERCALRALLQQAGEPELE